MGQTNTIVKARAAAGLASDPSTFNSASALSDYVLGGTYWYEGKSYKYVQFVDAVAYLAGHVCLWANATGTAVTNDKTGGSAIVATVPVAGVALRVMTEDYYGFIQVSGVATVQTDGGVQAGEFLVSHTVDGEADTMADGEEEQVFAIALADDVGDQCVVSLKGCA